MNPCLFGARLTAVLYCGMTVVLSVVVPLTQPRTFVVARNRDATDRDLQ